MKKILLLACATFLFGAVAEAQTLHCSLAKAKARIKEAIINGETDFPEETPIVKFRVIKKSTPKHCNIFRRITGEKECRPAVRIINYSPLSELNKLERRLVCKGKLLVFGFKNNQRFRRRMKVRGLWVGRSNEQDENTDSLR